MVEPDGNGISARLWRLPKQLLLALVNATAMLVIVAAILTLVAIARINRFTETVVATMTEAVLSKVDLPQKNVLADLQNLTVEARAWHYPSGDQDRRTPSPSTRIGTTQGGADPSECQRGPTRSARSILTDEAIGQLGLAVADALRDCSSSARQVTPDRSSENKTADGGYSRRSNVRRRLSGSTPISGLSL